MKKIQKIMSVLIFMIMVVALSPKTIFADSLSASVDQTSIDFGQFEKNRIIDDATTRKDIKITNDGTIPFKVNHSNPHTSGPFGSLSYNTETVIEPGQVLNVTLRVIPGSRDVGVYNGTYVFTITDAGDSSNTITKNISATVEIIPELERYSVSFHTAGGSQIATTEVLKDAKLTAPTAPTRDGYTFAGWYVDGTYSVPYNFDYSVTSDMTLYAKWDLTPSDNHVITFDSNGGTGTMYDIANLSGNYTLPKSTFTPPAGKMFKGWSLTSDGAIITTLDMTEDITVYAIWEDVNLSFEIDKTSIDFGTFLKNNVPDNASAQSVVTITNNSNTDITLNHSNPTEIFGSIWYSPTERISPGESKSVTLRVIPGGTGTNTAGTYNRTYVFTVSCADNPTINQTANVNATVKIVDSLDTYKVSFNANGGSGTMSDVTDLTGTYTLPESTFTAPTGKQFKGWSLTSDGAIITTLDMTEDKTVYAIWKNESINTGNATVVTPVAGEHPNMTVTSDDPTKYTVIVYQWVRRSDMHIMLDTDTFEAGEEYIVIVCFDAVGDNVLSYDNTFTINGSTTSWTINGLYRTKIFTVENTTPETYTVSFNTNEGSTVASQNIVSGQKAIEPTTPTKAGYTFDGWYTDDTYVNTYDFNTAVTANTTIYAKWQEDVITYNISLITYDITNIEIEGGSLQIVTDHGTATGLTPNKDATKDTSVTVTATPKAGYEFVAWRISSPSASNTSTNSSYTFVATDSIYIYAIFSKIPTVNKYNVTFALAGGTMTGTNPVEVEEGQKVAQPTTPTKAGYTFDGWYSDATFTIAYDFNTAVTANTTIYAKWSLITYKVSFNANGGSGTMSDVTDLTGTYTLPESAFTAPTGKQFKGWSLTSDGTVITTLDMTEDKTVYAIWEDIPKTYTYTFIVGENQEFTVGNISAYSFKIDGDHLLFASLEIGSLTLTNGIDYNVTEGSTIVTFTTSGIAKLNTLAVGAYDVIVYYTNDKEVKGKLTIKEIITDGDNDNNNNTDLDNGNNNNQNNGNTSSSNSNLQNTPNTFDAIVLYITTFVVSTIALLGSAVVVKKTKKNN